MFSLGILIFKRYIWMYIEGYNVNIYDKQYIMNIYMLALGVSLNKREPFLAKQLFLRVYGLAYVRSIHM